MGQKIYESDKFIKTGGTSSQFLKADGTVDSTTYTGDQDLSGYATETYVGTQIGNLVDSSPSTLNTLNELAAALGDDPNFATTVTNSIAAKLPLAGGTMTGTTNHNDNVYSRWGTGADLRLWHNGTNSYVFNYGGNLYLGTGDADKDTVILGDNGSGGETAYITVDGSSTHTYFSNPGNVGIGTDSPDAKLDIEGDFEAGYALKFTNTKGTGAVSGFRSHGVNGEVLSLYHDADLTQGWNVNGNSYFTGNVGIGTSTPDSLLHIEKTDTAYDVARGIHVDYTKNHTNTTGWGASVFGVRSTITHEGTGKTTDVTAGRFQALHEGTGTAYYLYGNSSRGTHNGSGNTGVIWGAFNSGQLTGTGTGTHPFLIGTNQKAELNNANATVANMAGIISAAKTTAGTVTGRIDGAWLELDCNQGAATTVDANILYLKSDTGNLTVSGTARSIYSNSTLPSEFGGSIQAPTFYLGSTSSYIRSNAGDTELYAEAGLLIQSADGVVIEISDVIDISGGGSLISDGSISGASIVKNGGTSSQFLKADGSVDSTVYTGDQDLSGYVTTNTTQTISGAKLFNNDVALNQTDLLAVATGYFSQISIGATSPTALFHIIDNTEQSKVRIGSDTSNYLSIDVAGDGDSIISAVGSGFLPPDINFNTNSTTVLKISGTLGYVGIGTVTPSEKLEVNGNVQAETLIATDLTDGYVPYSQSGTLGLQNSEIYQSGTGRVGIGTNTLSQALNVNGDVLATGYRVSAMQTAPAARNSSGTLGEIRITSNYIYVCYATSSWSRVALATSW